MSGDLDLWVSAPRHGLALESFVGKPFCSSPGGPAVGSVVEAFPDEDREGFVRLRVRLTGRLRLVEDS